MATCGWCEDAPWRLECALCDPRRQMRLCAPCAARWHARGAAQEHEVVDASGTKRPYRDWAREFADGGKAQSDQGAEPAGSQQEQDRRNDLGSGDAVADGEPDLDLPGSPAAGEGESGVNEEAEVAIELPLEREDEPMPASSESNDAPSSARSKAASLEKLARRFPTEDMDAHAALAALTLRAVLMQDALLCVYFSRCTAPECARAFDLHRRRKQWLSTPSDGQEDDETQWALAFVIHLDACVNTTCPLCIRARLRMNVGSIFAINRVLSVRRRELQHVADGASSTASDAAQLGFAAESRRKMLTEQIERMGQRRQQHVLMAKKLYQLKDLQPLHGFSFPRFRWHLEQDTESGDPPSMQITDPSSPLPGLDASATGNDGDDQPMPTASETETATSTAANASAGANSEEKTHETTDTVAKDVGETEDNTHGEVPTADAAEPDGRASSSGAVGLEEEPAPYESDHIDKLLAAKQAAPDSPLAVRAFDEVLALGCAIVDAGFCSPARASRCLLRCQSILTHLQHHVDLAVCSDAMCDAVEYHFAHLSQCQSRSSDVACEYCLRVRERELARAVESLEMEQPEADARVQSVINAMTDSLADDPPAEREQAIMQLEDELEQAEENKSALTEKLSAERLALRRVRRRLDREGLFSSASAQRLPPHLIKTRRVTLQAADMSDAAPGARRSGQHRRSLSYDGFSAWQPGDGDRDGGRDGAQGEDKAAEGARKPRGGSSKTIDSRALASGRGSSASSAAGGAGYRPLRPSDVLEAKLSRSVSANQSSSDRGVRRPSSSAGRVSTASAASSSALRSHASFLMRELDASMASAAGGVSFSASTRHSLDSSTLNDGGKLTRNMLGDSMVGGGGGSMSMSRRRSSAASDKYAPSLDTSPPLPPDSTISAEEVIRESLASVLSSSVYTDKDDFALPHGRRSDRDSVASSLAYSRGPGDSFAFSFSSRSTFRRSTISEQMLYETELFEPERELSVRELSEVLTANDEDVKSLEVTSIKEEEEDVKLENAKSRWAQHVKLKARNFLYSTMAGGKPTSVNAASSSSGSGNAMGVVPSPAMTEWAEKQKLLLTQLHGTSGNHGGGGVLSHNLGNLGTLGGLGGAAKLQKWNRWVHDRYQNNFGRVMQRAFKDDYNLHSITSSPLSPNVTGAFTPSAFNDGGMPTPDPTTLISIEEVISNPRMMRYYAAWLSDPADQSKLFFLCSFEEYRQFWCTLRANYQQLNPSAAFSSGRATPTSFSKDDVLMLRTYGVKIAMKYLARTSQFPIGAGLVDSDMLRAIKRDIATGGEDALRTFDGVAIKVKRLLMRQFPAFRQTDLFAEMRKTVEREVVFLEDILMNHRFANFFWVFCFPHNYHREIALWLDVEYEFKPAYRQYMGLLKSSASSSQSSQRQRHGHRSREGKDQAAYQCRKLLKYISLKYFAGDRELRNLDKSLSMACARLQAEQDNIITKFSLIHLELYHRFLTSRAYAEFALYPSMPLPPSHATEGGADDVKADFDAVPVDDSMRLSALLLSYGLRAHQWSEPASRDTQRKRSLEVLHSARGFEAIYGVLTFEAMSSSTSQMTTDMLAVDDGAVELRVVQHPLPHDPTPQAVDKSIENFLIPWSTDSREVVLCAPTCPAPMAFNFRMGDSSSGSELFAACMLIYKPAPPLSLRQLETQKLDVSASCRWVPYGVCILSKFPLVDLLRERLSEAYEYILDLETQSSGGSRGGNQPFVLEKKVLSKLARPVSADNISQYHQPPVSLPSLSMTPSTTSLSVTSLLKTLPRLDYSVRLLFDTLDVSTVLTVFTGALFECRILFLSSYLSVLLKVSESLRALMYPLLWPHVYLPVLPRRMLQYLECPTPFIFGVDKNALDATTMQELLSEELLIVDLDKGCVLRGEIPCALPDKLQYELRDALYECLKPNVSKSDHVFANHFPSKPLVFPEVAVRALFHQAVRSLLGDFGYHRYVWTDEYANNSRTVFFDEASYLAASPPEMREFRTLFIATQAFSEFMVSFHGFEDQIGQLPSPSSSKPSSSSSKSSSKASSFSKSSSSSSSKASSSSSPPPPVKPLVSSSSSSDRLRSHVAGRK